MNLQDTRSQFEAILFRPAQPGDGPAWAFLLLPRCASEKLARRGRITVDATINGKEFRATLEPDGQLSHWLRVPRELLDATGTTFGDRVQCGIRSLAQEPEPEVPADLQTALSASTAAKACWDETTSLARLDWIHWITTAKQSKTRAKRIQDACDMLSSGKRRVCCFDPSGYYSKAFRAPEAAGDGS
jgi:hypothetical protein